MCHWFHEAQISLRVFVRSSVQTIQFVHVWHTLWNANVLAEYNNNNNKNKAIDRVLSTFHIEEHSMKRVFSISYCAEFVFDCLRRRLFFFFRDWGFQSFSFANIFVEKLNTSRLTCDFWQVHHTMIYGFSAEVTFENASTQIFCMTMCKVSSISTFCIIFYA